MLFYNNNAEMIGYANRKPLTSTKTKIKRNQNQGSNFNPCFGTKRFENQTTQLNVHD